MLISTFKKLLLGLFVCVCVFGDIIVTIIVILPVKQFLMAVKGAMTHYH